jgi:hypothetical protein
MNFSVIPSDKFKKEARGLIKKFSSLKQELAELSTTLSNNPETGTSLGNNTYKIRLAIKSKGKGKKRWSKSNYLCSDGRERSLSIDYL